MSTDLTSYPHRGEAGRGLAPSRTKPRKPTACKTREEAWKKMGGNYETFFPAAGPGVHSKASVTFMTRSPFAGYFSFLALIIAFTFS